MNLLTEFLQDGIIYKVFQEWSTELNDYTYSVESITLGGIYKFTDGFTSYDAALHSI